MLLKETRWRIHEMVGDRFSEKTLEKSAAGVEIMDFDRCRCLQLLLHTGLVTLGNGRNRSFQGKNLKLFNSKGVGEGGTLEGVSLYHQIPPTPSGFSSWSAVQGLVVARNLGVGI